MHDNTLTPHGPYLASIIVLSQIVSSSSLSMTEPLASSGGPGKSLSKDRRPRVPLPASIAPKER